MSREPNSAEAPQAGAAAPGEDARAHPRVPFQGYRLELLAKGKPCSIRIRDMSCGGAAGLCDEALDVGAFVTVCFSDDHMVDAWVRWVRMTNVGLMFTTPLAPGFVRRLHRGHGSFVTVRPRK
ncbi:MAG: PilZ domain-containing protein [Allosphingosinicella sp.]|uniref:PilZ domain-containing protein n=1 Tax=Allosphingosinicella sp. TaxID=2823234 RepID=UPI00393C6DA1